MKLIFALQDPSNPNSLAMRMRRARAQWIKDLITRIAAAEGRCRILDLGGEPAYWNLFDRAFLEASKVHVTLVNPMAFTVDDPLFTAAQDDACELSQYEDGAFDLVHSNSVIEHVGEWSRMEAFAREARRLAPSYYVQTPYFWFPIEPHFSTPFFHWRPEQARARALMRRSLGFAERATDLGDAMRIVETCKLLDKTQFQFLFPDGRHVDERVVGLTKSLIAIRHGRDSLPN